MQIVLTKIALSGTLLALGILSSLPSPGFKKCSWSAVVLGELEEVWATQYGSHSSIGIRWQDSV
jgi:hypothetical protein